LMVGSSCNTLEESRNGNTMNTVRAKDIFFLRIRKDTESC